MKASILGAVFVALLAAATASAVVDLVPDNFDSVVDGSKGVFVEFYAPWCGHCKNLAPAWDALADAFKDASNEVVIAKVDADSNRDLGSRFGVSGFPTLKWFPKGSTTPKDYDGGRELDDLIKFVSEESGAKGRLPPKPVTKVAVLDPSNFDSIALDSNKLVFVEFYAPWCGHCKHLAPDWEKLGVAFQNEPNVVIAKVDADQHRTLGERYGVTGFPTLKFFPRGAEKTAETYEGARELDGLVAEVNQRANTKRTASGTFQPTVGRSADLDELAASFVSNTAGRADTLSKAEAKVKASSESGAEWYVKYMKALEKKGAEFVSQEKARLEGYLADGKTDAKKIDEFSIRINILDAFKN